MLFLLNIILFFLFNHWLVAVLLSIPAIYWRGIRDFDYWKKKGIPSPPVIPYLGNFYNYWVPSPLLYRQYFQKYGKVVGTYYGKRPVLLIADPAIIKRILTTDFHLVRNRPESSASHKIFGQNVVAAKGAMWKRQRSILNPMFSTLKLRKMEPLMQICVQAMIDSLTQIARSGRSLNVRNCMGNFTIDIIAKCAFGTNTNAHLDKKNPFTTAAKDFFAFRPSRFIAMSLLPRFIQKLLVQYKLKPLHIKEYDFFENACRQMVANRKKQIKAGIKNHDLLQLMLNAENQDGKQKKEKVPLSEEEEAQQKEFKDIIGTKYLTEEEVMAQMMIFLLAGYESTANTLSHIMYQLAVNPDVQCRLYEEIQAAKVADPSLSFATISKLEYLDAVICEVLRLHCPALNVPREASNEYYIPEYNLKVEKGTFILLDIFHNHTTDEYWHEPERFDPERFMGKNREKIAPYTYMPFSSGPRQCIGMRLSLTETKLGLASIVDQFQVVKTEKTTPSLQIKQGAFLLKTSPIFVGVKRRSVK